MRNHLLAVEEKRRTIDHEVDAAAENLGKLGDQVLKLEHQRVNLVVQLENYELDL